MFFMEHCSCLYVADNVVLRVALLYGFIEFLSESAVTTLFSNVASSDVTCKVDNVQLRYPTHCDDVAVVIRQLIDRCSQVSCFILVNASYCISHSNSVRPSVCRPSVTLWYCTQTNEARIIRSSL